MSTRRRFLGFSTAAFCSALVSPVVAATPPVYDEALLSARLGALAEGQLRAIASEPILTEAVETKNRLTGAYSANLIARLDGDWRREVYSLNNRSLIPSVMDHAASRYLKTVQARSDGLYTEFILMDARGLNVGLSMLTPDYWQGDEDKWLRTYPVGPRAVHVGPDELNTATGIWQRQVSITVVDRRSLSPIGALCAGVALERV